MRVENGHKVSKAANMNDKIASIEVQDGFDFDTLPDDLKVKVENGNEIKGNDITTAGYGIAATNLKGNKIEAGGIITITDNNGKSIKLTVKQEIDLATEQTLAKKEATQTEISGKEISLQVGANTADSQTLKVKIENVSTKSLGLDGDTITQMAKEGAKGTKASNDMIKSLDKALERVNTSRANLGAMQNRLETTASNLTTSNENLTAAESRIRDVDVAEEMMNLSKLNLINQAAQAMMSQAKSQPEGVMQLLR